MDNRIILDAETKTLLLFTATYEQMKAINNKQYKQESKRWFNTWLNVGFKMKGELKRSYESGGVTDDFTDELVFKIMDCFDAVLNTDITHIDKLVEHIKNYTNEQETVN